MVFRAAVANPEAEVEAVDAPFMNLQFMVYRVEYMVYRAAAQPSPAQRLRSKQWTLSS